MMQGYCGNATRPPFPDETPKPRQPSFGGVLFAGPKVLLAASPLTLLTLAGALNHD
jgi:hypothetical protein